MLGSLLRVPPGEAVDVTIVDRRTGKEWTVTIAPFEISATVVTVEDWNAHGATVEYHTGWRPPMVEVSWREAIKFCNEMSRRSGLTPAYIVEVVEVDRAVGWVPHDRQAFDDWVVAWDRPRSDCAPTPARQSLIDGSLARGAFLKRVCDEARPCPTRSCSGG